MKKALGVVADVSLSIQILHDRREATLVPIGEIDVHSSGTFGIAGELAVAEHPEHLHIDLSQVTFMDSSGIRGVEDLVAAATRSGVPCSVISPDGAKTALSGEMVVWSGSTSRVVVKPT